MPGIEHTLSRSQDVTPEDIIQDREKKLECAISELLLTSKALHDLQAKQYQAEAHAAAQKRQIEDLKTRLQESERDRRAQQSERDYWCGQAMKNSIAPYEWNRQATALKEAEARIVELEK